MPLLAKFRKSWVNFDLVSGLIVNFDAVIKNIG